MKRNMPAPLIAICVILLGLSGSKMLEAADKIGLRSAREVFADRA